MNYQNSSARFNETRRNNYRESCKNQEHGFFKIKKRRFNNDKYSKLCVKTLNKQHKTFLDNISGSPQHEKGKKSELGIKMAEKNRLQSFQTQIKKGLFEVCIVCNRCVHRRPVYRFKFGN